LVGGAKTVMFVLQLELDNTNFNFLLTIFMTYILINFSTTGADCQLQYVAKGLRTCYAVKSPIQ